MNAITLILGGAIAGSIVTLIVVGVLARHTPLLTRDAEKSEATPEQPPATAPFTASPPRLAVVPSGRHAAAAAPPRPRPTSPERDVERTHLMRAVQAERPIRVPNPTGLNEKAIAAALTRGVTRPSR